MVLAAVALAALSLLGHRALAFDPEAWVVWGREVWTLSLATGSGPSWKPLPVLLTAPFAAAGDAAPWLWLVVARAGALLAVAGVVRLAVLAASRAAGPEGIAAGVLAGALVACSPWWAFNAALGNAEPLMVAFAAWAAVAQSEGRDRAALALACGAALIRPEAWPFVALHGLWLMRERRLAASLVIGAGLAVLAAWFVPDLLSSGLGSTRGAAQPVREPPAFPFAAVLGDTVELLTVPVVAVLVASLVSGRLNGARRYAGAAAAYVLLVAVMAQAGFAGNPRYLVPALAAAAVATAVGAVRLAGGRRAWGAVALVVASALVLTAGDLRMQRTDLAARADLRRGLDAVVARAGGREALRACGPIRTGTNQRAIVARLLRQSIPDSVGRQRTDDPVLSLDERSGRWTFIRGRC